MLPRLNPHYARYNGDWQLGLKDGLGVYVFEDGEQYSGQYSCGKMSGLGVYSFANGNMLALVIYTLNFAAKQYNNKIICFVIPR